MDARLAAYLPQDRRQALARGADLPEQASGAALFADISGFTPLTEGLDARHQAGLGDFLTELRPAIPLFLRFGGIDYDTDPDAGTKLDFFIRRVQQIVTSYEATLLQLTIGDKGSYLYAG